MTYVFIFSSILLGAMAQISLKYGSNGASGISLFFNLYVLLGIGLYGLSFLLWIYTLPKVQLSFAYPMVSLGYVIVFVLSYFIFKEPIGPLRTAGLLSIIAGVLMIAKS